MIEKIGHIKNPLTVIALFAGIAEVGGTLILPALEMDVQKIYVWFLMLFPAFLVLLFYLTLWTKHEVLYAPSDFSDENNFIGLLRKSSAEAVDLKFQDEASLIVGEVSEGEETTFTRSEESTSDDVDEPNPLSSEMALKVARMSFRDKMYRIEEGALRQLSSDLDLPFSRNIESPLIPGFVFDGVVVDSIRPAVAEVKYVPGDRKYRPSLSSLDAVEDFWIKLPVEAKRNFKFHFVLVYRDGYIEQAKQVEDYIQRHIARRPYKTVVRLYPLSSISMD